MANEVLIANYELNNYKYAGFWNGRQYEHEAEVLLLKKLFAQYAPDLSTKRIMDIGGAFGRLTDLYAPFAKETLLADYSTHELEDGITNLKGKEYFSKVSYLALNAYKIPLKENSLDAILSVRVMHHLKDTKAFFSEIERVLTPGGIAIIEFANNQHVLSRLRRFFRGAKNDVITEVTHKNDSQGISVASQQVSVMYNFAPEYIKSVAKATNLTVLSTYTCSFLRQKVLKKLFPLPVLLTLEGLLQKLFASSSITPSIFIVLQKTSDEKAARNDGNILVCPTCRASVTGGEHVLSCENGHSFAQQNEMILDLRDPRPEEITY